jgi:selenocysteine-specific elongation factor
MPIIGTAGHVDHGKSTLVRALTGMDPDRLEEEKRRGLTIDLGFAWVDVDGHDIGFVDVPGHERFVKNMLAGVGAIDAALLVVAADSGWMPQTEEHAAVLDLLRIRRGVVAVTRVDLVDDDVRDLAVLEVHERVAGTGLETWPVIPVSAPTGLGLDTLRRALVEALDAHAPDEDRPFRMWIDRSFTVAGSGHVVTGSVASGDAAIGTDLEVLPQGLRVRVRGFQHHGRAVDHVKRGWRTAINLSGDVDSIGRGDVIATPGSAAVTQRLVLSLTPARSVGDIPDRGAFHLHIGTSSSPVRVRRLRDRDVFVATGDRAIVASSGDGAILRDSGRRAVVGGGIVLDPSPPRRIDGAVVDHLTSTAAVIETRGLTGDAAADMWADTLVRTHAIVRLDQLTAFTGGGTPSHGTNADGYRVSDVEMSRISTIAHTYTEAYHRDHPKREGMPMSELASRIGIGRGVCETAVRMVGDLVVDGAFVRLPTFSIELSDGDEAAWATARDLLEASYDIPRLRTTGLDPELVHLLVRRGDLVRIDDDLVVTARQLATLEERLVELDDRFTVSDFRDHFGMARRQAVPLLEYFDAKGATTRVGDTRMVRRRTG